MRGKQERRIFKYSLGAIVKMAEHNMMKQRASNHKGQYSEKKLRIPVVIRSVRGENLGE